MTDTTNYCVQCERCQRELAEANVQIENLNSLLHTWTKDNKDLQKKNDALEAELAALKGKGPLPDVRAVLV